ncbi:MAG: efflux RND transporter periplasmic adaptor subunit [Desulfuromonas sp.]|nr:MAG: efflux RND transporter periplasmic adaptor subunit [Desulfuromonas sp.]
MSRSRLRLYLPILILLLGGVGMVLLVKLKTPPQKEVPVIPGALVEVLSVAPEARTLTVMGTGTVQPQQEISIIPQVSGKVVEIAPALQAGGFFKQGELLFAIDPADYRLTLEQKRAALAKADVDLETVRIQAEIAVNEWQALHPDGEEAPPLARYEPQLKSAVAARAAAAAALEQAGLDLERTRLLAPFDGRIRSEQLALGQYVRSGTTVGEYAGTARAEIVVPLPLSELRWLTIPTRPGSRGALATIRFAAGESRVWSGVLSRSLGEVDAKGRMARVVVTVEDPYGLKTQNPPAIPLTAGMLVEVELEGTHYPELMVLPQQALRDDEQVWLATDEGLAIHPVSVLRQGRGEVLVSAGLAAGDQVVVSPLSGAAPGMKLRTVAWEPR